MKIRRFVAVDDCGNIINPMIVEGQVHGGLTMGLAPALFEEISYDEQGNIQQGSFMDYLLPTAMETPNWETDKTCTPSPHIPWEPRGLASQPLWALRRRLPMPWLMPSGTSGCATSIFPSRRKRSGNACAPWCGKLED